MAGKSNKYGLLAGHGRSSSCTILAGYATILAAEVMLSLCACTKAQIPADSSPASVSPAGIGTATLSWEPPRRNLDGSTISNLAGYWIFYGTSPTSLNLTIKIPDPYITTYTVDKLRPGTYYFSIVAITATGVRGSASPTMSKTIR